MANIHQTISSIRPKPSPKPLIRIGGAGDGGYLVPDDLEGITACYSPGVFNTKFFEDELVNKYNIACHMCDKSSDVEKFKTPMIDGLQTFKKKWLDIDDSEDSISLVEWLEELSPNAEDDLMLQMDIEGAEYRNLLDTPDETLKRFRMILIEFHNLRAFLDNQFHDVISKLDNDFACVHVHPNNCSDDFIPEGEKINLPNVIELTFLRKDRIGLSEVSFDPILPNPLDVDNVPGRPPLFLNSEWLMDEKDSDESKIRKLTAEIRYLKSQQSKNATRIKKIEKGYENVIHIITKNHRLLSDEDDESGNETNDDRFDEVAIGKRFVLSSRYGNFDLEGVVAEQEPFFFHTDFGEFQYITIDLQKEYRIQSIRVRNRTDVAKERAKFLFYQTHNNKPINDFNGDLLKFEDTFFGEDSEEVEIAVAQNTPSRYLSIFSPMDTALHLSSIKVYGFQVE